MFVKTCKIFFNLVTGSGPPGLVEGPLFLRRIALKWSINCPPNQETKSPSFLVVFWKTCCVWNRNPPSRICWCSACVTSAMKTYQDIGRNKKSTGSRCFSSICDPFGCCFWIYNPHPPHTETILKPVWSVVTQSEHHSLTSLVPRNKQSIIFCCFQLEPLRFKCELPPRIWRRLREYWRFACVV